MYEVKFKSRGDSQLSKLVVETIKNVPSNLLNSAQVIHH